MCFRHGYAGRYVLVSYLGKVYLTGYCDVTAGHYYSQLMTAAAACSCTVHRTGHRRRLQTC